MKKQTVALIALFAGWILTADIANATTYEDNASTGVDVELVTGAEADKLFTEMTQRLQMSSAQKQEEKPI